MNRRQWFCSRAAAEARQGAAKRRTGARAYTLVELLVVVAIGVLLLGISVPAFVRIVSAGNNDPQNGARELFTLLRAARQYAITNRVPCAVVYSTQRQLVDSATNDCARVADTYALARGLNDREFSQMAPALATLRYADNTFRYADPVSIRNLFFVPVNEGAGNFQEFPGTAGIENIQFFVPDCTIQDTFLLPVPDALGLLNVELIDVDPALTVVPVDYPGFPVTPSGDHITNTYPAHVFMPSGEMFTAVSDRERYVIEVGQKPDALLSKRFIEPSGPYNTLANRMAPVVIELYRGTGRSRMTQ
ncbi:MAG: hypothetical protein AMXMBFR84_02300 [Candidatus Hydrogenedentota bacterium]